MRWAFMAWHVMLHTWACGITWQHSKIYTNSSTSSSLSCCRSCSCVSVTIASALHGLTSNVRVSLWGSPISLLDCSNTSHVSTVASELSCDTMLSWQWSSFLTTLVIVEHTMSTWVHHPPNVKQLFSTGILGCRVLRTKHPTSIINQINL